MKIKTILAFSLIALVLAACKSSETPETPRVKNPPTINSFRAYPTTIDKGETTTLSWSTTNASSASIDQGIGSVAASGSLDVKPTASVTYTLTVRNNDGTATAKADVTVKEVAVLVLDGDPSKGMKSYGCPYFYGYVKNIGTVTGYNCKK
jgi:hypothetical protein